MSNLHNSIALLRSHPDWPNDRDVAVYPDTFCPPQSVYVIGDIAFANGRALRDGLLAVAIHVLPGELAGTWRPIRETPMAVVCASGAST